MKTKMEAQRVDTDRPIALYGPFNNVEHFDEDDGPSVVDICQIRSVLPALQRPSPKTIFPSLATKELLDKSSLAGLMWSLACNMPD
jgi:hypothetical protein